MAKLKKCKSCGNMVSTDAKTCPQCGARVKKSHGCLLIIVFLILVLIAISSAGNGKTSGNNQTSSNDAFHVKVFVDSDGDISECLAWFRDAGIDGILPLERMAGVDVRTLREHYPEALFIGAFDKTVMHRGEAAIRAEFERLMPVAAKGGVMRSCDHQTPPEVSLQDYQLYLKLFREYAAQI